jgi:translation initiation factor 2 subunit 3
MQAKKAVEEASCGGLVGVGTLLDPSYSKADGLTGNIAGKVGLLPPTLTELTLETRIWREQWAQRNF